MTAYVLLEIDDHSEVDDLIDDLTHNPDQPLTTAAGHPVRARVAWVGADNPKVECECGIFDEQDDDDHEPITGDPGNYDGGFGAGSYFDHAMRKDD